MYQRIQTELGKPTVQFLLMALLSQAFIIVVFCYFFVSSNLNIFRLQSIFTAWDARLYLSLAEFGYKTSGDEANFIVFFPLYPLLIRMGQFITQSYIASGLLISTVFSILGHYYFYLLIRLKKYSVYTQKIAALFLLVSPISIYFSAVYTESTFFFLTVVFFYFLEKKQLYKASGVGLLAAATRIMGVTLVVPFIQYLLINKVKLTYHTLLQLIVIPCGYLMYLLLNFFLFGDAFHYQIVMQEHWYKMPINPIVNYYNLLLQLPLIIPTHSFTSIDKLMVLIFPMLIVVYVIYMMRHKKMITPVTWVVWMAVQYLIIATQSYALSSTRYLFIIFPVYILLAEITAKHRILTVLFLLIFGLLSVAGISQFSTGGFLY